MADAEWAGNFFSVAQYAGHKEFSGKKSFEFSFSFSMTGKQGDDALTFVCMAITSLKHLSVG